MRRRSPQRSRRRRIRIGAICAPGRLRTPRFTYFSRSFRLINGRVLSSLNIFPGTAQGGASYNPNTYSLAAEGEYRTRRSDD